jgi:protein disulfide-isomerase-like protein
MLYFDFVTIMLPTTILSVGSTLLMQPAAAQIIGQPHSTVIPLSSSNFDEHINDNANPLWLLEFYAPWCFHCKRLAPILDSAASHLAGKLAIGKIDCTVEKSVCKGRFDIRGYPTLKYYRDGEFQDYPLGRDEESIISFGDMMSRSAVRIVKDVKKVYEELLRGDVAVAYVVYDPTPNGENDKKEQEDNVGNDNGGIDAPGAAEEENDALKLIQSSERTRVFAQVARKYQAHGNTFGLLSPTIDKEEIAQVLGLGDTNRIPPAGFIARIEEGVPTKLFTGHIHTQAFYEFIKETNLAVMSELGGHNFRVASRRGKPLAIGVYDPDDHFKTTKFRKEMKQYAVEGTYKDEYVFGTMDGKKWEKFISQFSITKAGLPEMFILNVPERMYWQDSSVLSVADFIKAVQTGEIESRLQEKSSSHNPLEEFSRVFIAYMPWSLLAMLSLFIVVFWLALPSSDPIRLPPEAPSKKEEGDKEEESKKDK